MPVRGLDGYLQERGLIKEAPLSALSQTRIGIDANSYLKRLLLAKDPVTSDTFVAAVGGVPLALGVEIERDLKSLEKAGVKPVFVFNGLSPRDFDKPFILDEHKSLRRSQAWDNYEQGRVQHAQQLFADSAPVIPQDVMRIVHRLFKQRSVEFVVAPYLAWAQLVYLERHERAYVHSIYGASELFMFDGVERVILDINFATSTISFATKQSILQDLALSHDQLLDTAILAGFEHTQPFPALPFDMNNFSFPNVATFVKQRGSGVAAIMAYRDHPPIFGWSDHFARARCMIKFSLVLVAQEGRVLPLPLVLPPPASPASTVVVTAADVPADLADIFSPHLPDEVYYQVFRGLVGPQVITPLASGVLYEAAPLCGSTPEYEIYIKNLTELAQSPRCVALALVSSVLHPSWAVKEVYASYYFNPPQMCPIRHGLAPTNAFIESVTKWNVDARFVENELRRQASSTIDLSLCLGGTSDPIHAQRTIIPKNSEKLLEKKDEIVANALWRFLELRSFLTASHQHTPYAAALYQAMKLSKVNDKFQEALYLAIELLRGGALHNGRIGTRLYSGGPNFNGAEEDKRSMLLVMRVLSIVPLSFHPGPWAGPVSRELLVFNSFLRATSRSMRTLLEATALNILLRSDARRAREDYLDIALSLPFQTDTNTGMGILFKAFGDTVCHMAGGVDVVMRAGTGTVGADAEEKEAVRSAKEQTLELLTDAFPNVKNVAAELQRGLRFWHLIMLAVRFLRQYQGNGQAIQPDLVAQFEAADAWLKPFSVTEAKA
ncbi:hypothetical protein RQP46_005876 [Phenoliferia psychrophenolica]